MSKTSLLVIIIIVLGLCAIGCENAMQPIEQTESLDSELSRMEALACPPADHSAPAPLVTVGVGTDNLECWPYTGVNYYGQPQDPINLIFYGKADPLDIRAALLSLSGDRSGFPFPPVPPFTLTWQDAIGDEQVGYGLPDGWTGSVVQLCCGDYAEPRFHIRLFKVGDWTVANVHFEILIPGTTDHQVLSWELAEQLVTADFVRSGFLDPITPVIPTDQINDAPFRTIPYFIYNELPVELRMLIGGPLEDVSEDVGIPTDGHAVILNLANRAPRQPGVFDKDFVIEFGQVIPKPFCASGPGDYLYVQGPVRMQQTVSLTPGGTFSMSFKAVGELAVTPVNPLTGEPIGETLEAIAYQRHTASMNSRRCSASGLLYQRIGEYGEPEGGALFTRLQVNSPHGLKGYQALTRCGTDTWGPVTSAKMQPRDISREQGKDTLW